MRFVVGLASAVAIAIWIGLAWTGEVRGGLPLGALIWALVLWVALRLAERKP